MYRQKHIPEILLFFVDGGLTDCRNVILIERSRCVEVLQLCRSGHLHVFQASVADRFGFDRVIIISPDTDFLIVLMCAFCA